MGSDPIDDWAREALRLPRSFGAGDCRTSRRRASIYAILSANAGKTASRHPKSGIGDATNP